MTDTAEQLDLMMAVRRVEIAVFEMPYGAGVVRRAAFDDSLLERLNVIEQNLNAIKAAIDNDQPSRVQNEDEAREYRQLRGIVRRIMRDTC